MVRAVLAALLLAVIYGCATIHGKTPVRVAKEDPKGKVFVYPRHRLRIMAISEKAVQAHCVDEYTLDDDNNEFKEGDIAVGCHSSGGTKDGFDEIVLERSCRGAQALPHELAHWDGMPKKTVNAAYGWPENEQ